MNIFILKEKNLLDSGESKLHVSVYRTDTEALNAMKQDIEEHIDNNNAYITDGVIGDWNVEMTDEQNNQYSFEIEKEYVKYTEFYILKEKNVLDSGEIEFYINVYDTKTEALNAMKQDIEGHINNNNAYITDGVIGDLVVEMTDKENNQYIFEIEIQNIK